MIRSLLQRLGSPYAISLRVWLWSTPLVIIGTALSYGVEIFLSHTFQALLMAVLSHLAVGLLSALVSVTYLRKSRWTKPRPILILFTYAVMGLSRGLIASFSILLMELPTDPNFVARSISGIWVFLFWATLLTLVFESSQRYRTALSELSQKVALLAKFSSVRNEKLHSLRVDFISQVEQILAPALARVKSAFDLEALANKIIEPTSYSMLESGIRESERLATRGSTIAFRDLAKRAKSEAFPAGLIAAFSTLALSLPLLSQARLTGLFQLTLVFGAVFIAVKLLNSPRRWPDSIQFALVILTVVLTLASALFVDLLAPQGRVSMVNSSVGIWLIALFLVYLITLDRERETLARSFAKALDELEILESKLQQELYLERRQLQQLVHSEVQGRLRAAAVIAKVSGLDADVEKLKSECVAALSGASNVIGVAEFHQELTTLWGRALDLSFAISTAALKALQRDSYLRGAYFALVREAIVNAVKHGRCTNIEISGALTKAATFSLEVVNDGAFGSANRVGQGTRVFEELSLAWSLTRRGELTRATFELASVGD